MSIYQSLPSGGAGIHKVGDNEGLGCRGRAPRNFLVSRPPYLWEMLFENRELFLSHFILPTWPQASKGSGTKHSIVDFLRLIMIQLLRSSSLVFFPKYNRIAVGIYLSNYVLISNCLQECTCDFEFYL